MSSCVVVEEDDQTRNLRPLEKGGIRAAISWAARQLDRAAPDWGGIAPSQAKSSGTSGTEAGSAPAQISRKRKVSHILDQASDVEIVVMSEDAIRKLFEQYSRTMGGKPQAREEPSADQLSALAHVLGRDEVPFVDFAIWGPDGRRSGRLMKFQAQ
eukprot:6467167-Amphidinium_carterae.1